jgi:hypothetical protein
MYVSPSVLPSIGMSVAAFVPSVSLSFYWPILFCHTNRATLPPPLDPMCLHPCGAPLSHFLIFHSCKFRFFIFVRLLLLFYLNFTINLSAHNFLLTAFSFPLKRTMFIFFYTSQCTVCPLDLFLQKSYYFLVSSVLTGKFW